MSLTCPKCELAGTQCICEDLCTEEATCTCLDCQKSWRAQCVECEEDFHPDVLNPMGLCDKCAEERFLNNPPMAPIEIQGAVDKHWRQFRDKANQDIHLRAAIKELLDQLEERAEELRTGNLDLAQKMILGGIHPNQRRFMD